jgi:hypothetical protein
VPSEKKYGLEPLKNWFRRQKAKWQLKEPENDRSETGRDIDPDKKRIRGCYPRDLIALFLINLKKNQN